MTLDWNGLLLNGFVNDKAMLEELYVNQQLSIEAIAAKIGVSKQTIRTRLKKHRIEIRSRGGKNHMSNNSNPVKAIPEPLKFDGVGPAFIVVPLSEDSITRFMFNDLVDLTEEGKLLTTEDELQRVWDLQGRLVRFMSNDAIGQTLLPDPDLPESREVYRKFHKELYELYEKHTTSNQ